MTVLAGGRQCHHRWDHHGREGSVLGLCRVFVRNFSSVRSTTTTGSQRERVNFGTWRHSKYELRLFLIAAESVRELARQLNVKQGTFQGNERGHFRFDAVSSLRVTESGNYDHTLELTLSKGPTRTIDITEPERSPEQTSLDEPGLARISLDSTGFTHTLHVLEGIAAEGNAWLQHEAATTDDNGYADSGNEAAA